MKINRKAFPIITPPTVEPVTLAEVKAQGHIDSNAEDTLLTSLITSERIEVEDWTKRALITQTRQLIMDCFEGNSVKLPFPEIQSVTHIKTYDDNDSESTFSSDNYHFNAATRMIQLKTGQSWPTDLRPLAAVEIEYVCGYGDSRDDVPQPLKQAILERIIHRFTFRGDDQKVELDKALDLTVNTINRHMVDII